MIEYDYLLVGAGLFNAIFAREAAKDGKKCLVIERRSHMGGNLYCEVINEICVHRYGAHIFHTSNKEVWDYMTQLCTFNHFVNAPIARYKGEVYNLPFNMNTFYQLWKVITPGQAAEKINSQRLNKACPENLEEQALSLVGTDIYHKLIKGYTEKQWGKKAHELPAYIIRRIPLRFSYDNNYFSDPYQGIPIGGYNPLIQKCFEKADVLLDTDFTAHRQWGEKARKIIYTGTIDGFYNYCYGALEYRSLRFEDEILDVPNYQGNAVVNYTEKSIPYTRIIEHKYFEFGNQPQTVITREYPQGWDKKKEPFYPVPTEQNQQLYQKYKEKALHENNVIFAGRLGEYAYRDMDQTVMNALLLYEQIKLTI